MKPEPMPPIDWSQPVHPQEIEQMRDFARLSLWEKMGWLEEAQIFADHMHARFVARQKQSHQLNES